MTYPILDAKATGERIKELRKAHHLKVEDIARFMGFESEQAVYKWQRGDSLPTVDNLYALSRLFDTTVDDILRGSKEEDEKSSSFLFRLFYSLFYGERALYLDNQPKSVYNLKYSFWTILGGNEK